MISIITPSYNAATTLADNLTSIGNQTFRKGKSGITTYGACSAVEHLLIDGRSTDDTLVIAKQHGSHLAKIVSESDRGIYDAMNKGLKLATGDIIGILNADDIYADDQVLQRVATVFKNPEVEACYGDLLYIKERYEKNEIPGGSLTAQNLEQQSENFHVVRYWKSGPFHLNKFQWGWMPPHPTFFVRRSVYEKYGFFNLALGSAADYELMLRFLLKNRIKVFYIPEVLVKMRVGGVSNATLKNRLKANQLDRKAWEINGLRAYPWTFLMKPLRKIPQWWQRPRHNLF
ncbi:MAG: glycosyltransferase family 2 protein [Desulfuromonadaceae bacterium]|nr:glycosyltransferase family 2 protein [Desulfuromonadaceae bacterium]